ncbi:1-deoxy-D-xylulose 5-phosphate reductoisomerase C-terminal family protein, partial [Vibrio parahaemolyticus AQ3810]
CRSRQRNASTGNRAP